MSNGNAAAGKEYVVALKVGQKVSLKVDRKHFIDGSAKAPDWKGTQAPVPSGTEGVIGHACLTPKAYYVDFALNGKIVRMLCDQNELTPIIA